MLKLKYILFAYSWLALLSCKGQISEKPTIVSETVSETVSKEKIINTEGTTIATRFIPPKGFVRPRVLSNSFAAYLQNLPLKADGSEVIYFDGATKTNNNVYCGVVQMDIGNRDLQQCADAVMRLRGEYLFQQKQYDKIKFNFASDGKARTYLDYAKEDRSYKKFRKYMNYIFAYANTRSLHNQLEKVVDFSKLNIGDVFIQKGNPFGHAVIVVDLAINPSNGKKIYLLAQSYMPAQETQILINPHNLDISPWYELQEGSIFTPEWTFEPETFVDLIPTDMDKALQTMISNYKEKTGKTLEQWLVVVSDSGLAKHGEIMKLLKGEHGMTHGFANLVAMTHKNGLPSATATKDLIPLQYTEKENLKAIYDLLTSKISKFGEDVEFAPKKAYVSLRVKKQFGIIQPSTKTRLDVGINLKQKEATDRLEISGSFNQMVSHRVRITDIKEIDDELLSWLKEAYEAAK